jgi:ATP-dependent RNA helicase DDX49/DBP8
LQIADQFAVIGKAINLKQCVVTGGMDMVLQGQELAKRPHIVVATPGRYVVLVSYRMSDKAVPTFRG